MLQLEQQQHMALKSPLCRLWLWVKHFLVVCFSRLQQQLEGAADGSSHGREKQRQQQITLRCLYSSGNELFSESAHLGWNTTRLKIYCCKFFYFFTERRRGSCVGTIRSVVRDSLWLAKQDPLGARGLGIRKSCDEEEPSPHTRPPLREPLAPPRHSLSVCRQPCVASRQVRSNRINLMCN